MIELINQLWHWAFSGMMIVVVMFLLTYLGKSFGVSSSFQTVCSAAGAGKWSDYFKYDWKEQSWLLFFIVGSVIGGYIANTYLHSSEPVQLAQSTIEELSAMGIEAPGYEIYPTSLFDLNTLSTPKGLIIFVLGGILVGFGARYAGGCTSGHAISGLSNMQLPSLISVIGFFIGGLLTTHVLLPLIL